MLNDNLFCHGCHIWLYRLQTTDSKRNFSFFMDFEVNGPSPSCVHFGCLLCSQQSPGQLGKSECGNDSMLSLFFIYSLPLFLFSQCWRKMIITSPKSLNLPGRSHPFSQSAPTELNHMGWPEPTPDIGELYDSLFSLSHSSVLTKRTRRESMLLTAVFACLAEVT